VLLPVLLAGASPGGGRVFFGTVGACCGGWLPHGSELSETAVGSVGDGCHIDDDFEREFFTMPNDGQADDGLLLSCLPNIDIM